MATTPRLGGIWLGCQLLTKRSWVQLLALSHRPAYRQPVNYIHRRHLLSLLSLKADTHSKEVEG